MLAGFEDNVEQAPAEQQDPASSHSGESINLVQQRGPFDNNYEAPVPQRSAESPYSRFSASVELHRLRCQTPATELVHGVRPRHLSFSLPELRIRSSSRGQN